MDLALTETQTMLQQSARDLLTDKYPLAALRTMDAMPTGFSPDLWKDIVQLGWTGLALPSEWGGQDGSLLDLAVLYEEMGRACLPLPHLASAVLCGRTILAAGSEEQRREFLTAIAEGRQRWALALTEQDYSWEPEGVRLSATREGEGYRLQGKKCFIPYAAGADHFLVAARTNFGGGASGITLFVVDSSTGGISLRDMPGWNGDKIAEIDFDNVLVDSAFVVGEVDKGWRPLSEVLDAATTVVCAYITGGCQQVFEMVAEYARGRVQFGVPIGSFQRVQDRILEMINAADGARWTTYEAVWKLEAGRPDAREAVSVAKIVASQGFTHGTEETHHVYAGYGADRNLGLWQYTRKARTLYHFLGDPEHHRARLAEELDL